MRIVCALAAAAAASSAATPVGAGMAPTPTRTVTPHEAPSIETAASPTHQLRQTIRGTFACKPPPEDGSGTISNFLTFSGAEFLSVETDCAGQTYSAEILLLPDRANDVTVCQLFLGPGLMCRTASIVHESAAVLAVDVESDAADLTPGDGECATADGACSLRAAVQEANASPAAETVRITLARGTYGLTAAGGEDDAAIGALEVTGEVVIAGAGVKRTAIQAASNGFGAAGAPQGHRAFDVRPDGVLVLSDLAIRAGRAPTGGGISNEGVLVAERVLLTGNTAGRDDGSGGAGGAIHNLGRARLVATSIDRNTAFAIDGVGTSGGGGIFNEGELTLEPSTVSDNEAGRGGGIQNDGDLYLSDSTVSGNRACCYGDDSIGGGIWNNGDLSLVSVTIAANAAARGSGLFGPASATNTIFADNPPDTRTELVDNCDSSAERISSSGFNIDSNGSCGLTGSNDRAVDPMLGPLQDNGGPTLTHALLAGSPAIDASRGWFCSGTDQRGARRPADGDGKGGDRCDVGAFEVVPPCSGDCDGLGSITIDELTLGVQILLEHAPLSACRPFDADSDGRASIADAISAVNAALYGCPGR